MAPTTSPCHFDQRPARVNACHWTGTEYIRVDICNDCLDAGKLAKAPKRPRKRRTTTHVPATDWNYLVAFSQGRKR